MAVEQKWLAVPPQAFTSDGTSFGVITIADTAGYRTKQIVSLKGTSLPEIALQVKRVLSPTQFIVGPTDNRIGPNYFTDISAYTVAAGSNVSAGEQVKGALPPDKDHYSAIYEADPVVADRVIMVDQYGQFYGVANPMPIIFDGTISIGEVVVRGTNGNSIEPNPGGSINVVVVDAPVAGQHESNTYNQVTSVANGVVTQIVSYTVPFAKTACLHKIQVSGDNFAVYDVLLNGSPIATQRTWYGQFNANFDFFTAVTAGLTLIAGDIVSVRVLHTRPFLGTFDARIQLIEIT